MDVSLDVRCNYLPCHSIDLITVHSHAAGAGLRVVVEPDQAVGVGVHHLCHHHHHHHSLTQSLGN